MKYLSVAKILLTVATSLGVVAASKPIMAQNIEYSCSWDNEQLSTVANTIDGKVKLIEWHRIASLLNGGEANIGSNCLEVTSRLQSFVEKGNPAFISVGRLSQNDYFLCTANSSGDCVGDNFGFLMMLKNGSEPETALKQMFGFPSSYSENNGKVAIDLNRLIAERTQIALNNRQNNDSSYRQYPVKLPSTSNNTQSVNRNSSPNHQTATAPTKITQPTSPQPINNNPASISNPKQNQYRCENSRTVAYTRRGKIELIVWKSQFFEGYTPEMRCQMIADRFQNFSDAKKLRFLSTGKINYQPVICVSDRSGNCVRNGLLLTLEPDDNPEQVLKDLFDISARTSNGGVSRADRDKLILDFRRLLYTSDTTY